jgi:hypothetical protein
MVTVMGVYSRGRKAASEELELTKLNDHSIDTSSTRLVTQMVKRSPISTARHRGKTGFQSAKSTAHAKPMHTRPVWNTADAQPVAVKSDDPALEMSLLQRLQRVLPHLVKAAGKHHQLQALSASTPIDSLIYLLSSEAVVADVVLSTDDPLRAAKARAAQRMSELLGAEGGPIGVEEVAQRLRMTRAGVDKRRRSGTLIAVDNGSRRSLYPVWQLTETGVLPGLEDALRVIGVKDPWMQIQFFLARDPELEMSPLEALRTGRRNDVVSLAKRFGRHGDDG